ncbi:hypothetical protein [Lentzea sp. NPDC060358]|uniref:hypothetical protein n=1 Tax=Lentzea sp. NPDC060358 TaxID=3347103 RepID=UPI003652F832
MNLTDLTEVLRDRAQLPDSPHEARMAGVRARVSSTRRKRAVAGAACVVLALVGIVYATLPRPQALPGPAVPPRSLPEYQLGTRLVGQAWGDLPATTVTLRFVPKSLDLSVFTRCETGSDDLLVISTTINDHPYTGKSSCGATSHPTVPEDFGVVLGQPSVIVLTVVGRQGSPTPEDPFPVLPPPASGSFAVGIGEAVPVDEYPFPPRPQTLETFEPKYPAPEVELRSDPANPAGRREFPVTWPGSSGMRAQLNTPGRLRVLVDGVEVIDLRGWSYEVSSMEIFPNAAKGELQFAQGQSVTITVITERVTGDWEVGVVPRDR